MRALHCILRGHSRHSGWFWCWIRSWRRPASLFGRGLWRASLGAKRESWASATNRDVRKTTRRATGDRLRHVYKANTQRKGFKTSGKEGRLRTLYRTLGGHPRHLEKPRCWIRPPHRPALLFEADSRGRLRQTRVVGKRHQQSRPQNNAPSHRRSIPPGLARQHAEERRQTPIQSG